MSNIQKLGELVTVDNENIDNNLQSKTLTVGYVKLDGEVVAVAFTGKELNRPKKRALDNKEDLPALEQAPPTREALKEAKDLLKSASDNTAKAIERHAETQKELDFLKERGFFARLLNVQYCEDCEDGKCDDSGKPS